MILVFWPKSYAGSIVEPESSPLGLSFEHFQHFLTAYPFDSLVVDVPSFRSWQCCYPAISVTSMLTRQICDTLREKPLLLADSVFFLLR
jgi:hypothetical protein